MQNGKYLIASNWPSLPLWKSDKFFDSGFQKALFLPFTTDNWWFCGDVSIF